MRSTGMRTQRVATMSSAERRGHSRPQETVVSAINHRCICSKSAAKSRLRVEVPTRRIRTAAPGRQHPPGSDMIAALEGQYSVARLARDRGWDAVATGQHYLSEGVRQVQLVPFFTKAESRQILQTDGFGDNRDFGKDRQRCRAAQPTNPFGKNQTARRIVGKIFAFRSHL